MLDFSEPTAIPSVTRLSDLAEALASPSPYVLLGGTHIGNLLELSNHCSHNGKQVLVHVDLVGGFKPDRDGIRLLRHKFGIFGIFTQSSQVVSMAQKAGLIAIFRVFLSDSRFLEQGLKAIQKIHPDGIELLPAVIAAEQYQEFLNVAGQTTMIAGGFIKTNETVQRLYRCGFSAITTSTPALWQA